MGHRGQASAGEQPVYRELVAVPTPPATSDNLIDQVVNEINLIQRTAAFDLTLRMGKLIVDRFYGGDLSVWRKHKHKETSFRKLAARTNQDLNVTATTLYRAVALYELTQRLGVSAWQHLSLTHLRAVLGLPEDQQRRLLSAADSGQWTTKRIEAEAAELRQRQTSRKRGRPPLPEFVKVINRLVSVLVDRDLNVDLEELRRMGDAEVERLCRTPGPASRSGRTRSGGIASTWPVSRSRSGRSRWIRGGQAE